VRRQHNILQRPQRMIDWQRFGFKNIESRSANAIFPQSVHERLFV
jgi:hypothetical protein